MVIVKITLDSFPLKGLYFSFHTTLILSHMPLLVFSSVNSGEGEILMFLYGLIVSSVYV